MQHHRPCASARQQTGEVSLRAVIVNEAHLREGTLLLRVPLRLDRGLRHPDAVTGFETEADDVDLACQANRARLQCRYLPANDQEILLIPVASQVGF